MLDEASLSAALAGLCGTSAGADVVSAFLFGSRIEGRAHRESDVDAAVLLDPMLGPRQRFEARLRLSAELIAALHCNDIDLVVLNDAPPLFARRVVREGRRVWCRDARADHAFRRDIQLRAADLEPFVERGRRALLARALR
ncbi:MAG: nucleotidyltransferase domain-containing protein [Acidobacteriota bacterium]|nr:nucleotidyltransferase domain-containing protein [Acidobacteriota bacterium]